MAAAANVDRQRTARTPRPTTREWLIAALLLCAVVPAGVLLVPRSASADVAYLYDELNRLVRVIRHDGEAATYHYDAVGNILRITRESGVAQTTALSSISPATIALGASVTVAISGSNLVGAGVSTTSPGLTITNVRTTFDRITFDLVVAETAPLGSNTLTVSGQLAIASAAVDIIAAPMITAFSPGIGAAGTTVIVHGRRFDDRDPSFDAVAFNGVPAIVQSVTRTSITALVPAGADTGFITVTAGGTTATTATVFITGSVSVSGVRPSSGWLDTTVPVMIPGTNLLEATISAHPSLSFQNIHVSATQITADLTIQAFAAAGPNTITVITPLGSASTTFDVLAVPEVRFLEPASGPAGTTVSVVGKNFILGRPDLNTVTFNGSPAIVQRAFSEVLTVLVPPGATSGVVTVTTESGSATSATAFITGAVSLASVSPTQVVRGDTVPIMITGSNLLGSAPSRPGITFSGTSAASTQISTMAIVALDAARTGAITATNGDGSASIPLSVRPGAPAITSFSPTSGGGGDTVTITGSGFDEEVPSNNVVKFNGVAAEIVSITPLVITTRVPPGATTGSITVTTPVGTATSAASFTITAVLRIVGSITAPFDFPYDVRFNADASRAYLLDGFDPANVRVIDTSTNTLLRTIRTTVAANTAGLFALAPDGTRLYLVGDTATSAIDLVTNVEAAAIPAGGAFVPGQIALAPDGRSLYIVDRSNNAVSVIDTTTNTVATTLAITDPVAVNASPDGTRVYVMGSASDTITVIDPATHAMAGTIAGAGSLGVFSPDGSRFYHDGPPSDITVIDTATNAVVATIADVGEVFFLAIDPTGTRLYAPRVAPGAPGTSVAVIDTASNAEIASIDVPGIPIAMALTPDGRRLALVYDLFTTPQDSVTIIDTTASAVVASVSLLGSDGFNIAASNGRLYVSMLDSGSVSVVDLATNALVETAISRTGAAGFPIVFSPDGRAGYGPAASIIAGFSPSTLAARPNLAATFDPANLPFDVRVQVVAIDPVTGGTLYVAVSGVLSFIDTATRNTVATLSIPDVIDIFPSPDGRRLVTVSASSTTRSTITVIDVATRAIVATLTPAGAAGGSGVASAMSPNGTRLYVAEHSRIFAIDPADPRLVTTLLNETFVKKLVFTPDGAKLFILYPFGVVTAYDTATNTALGLRSDIRAHDLVVSPDGSRVYLAGFSDASLAIVDTATLSVTATIPLPSVASRVVITPSGARVFALQAVAGAVSAIDTATATLVASSTLTAGLGEIVVAPNGRAFIQQFPDQIPGTLVVIE